ncbi:ABC transporter substrate-binding protein [Sporichthya brevicatena]|uniref:ABC transporter substrate-binding protein n=1 Tax=Sporichthya brevicatena TaxID=171442 RepID=A0ABN1H9P4_9ACTN
MPIVGSSGCARQLEPIRIGQNGSFSGLVGNSIGGLRTGAALWAKAVNAAGGIACHPIQLFQTDDQSNPTKAATNVKDLIQNKKVVALIGLGSPIVIASVRAELDKAGIPAIGGTQVELDWEQDPLLYNVGGWGFPSMAVVVKQAAINSGGKKFGLMHCVEATLCTTFKDKFSGAKGYAARLGLDFAFSQSFSLTQSSFTSACQNAKAAGVDVLFPVSDASAFQRLVRDCAAINYKPAYVSGSIALSAPVAVDPNVRSHGVLVGAPVAPFVSSGGAGLAAFNAAAKQYLGQQPLDQNILMGWASGQLLAKALAQVGAEARGGAVTTAVILKGLSKVKGETLDGLTPPMTLASNSAPLECGYVLAIGTTGYEAPIGRKVVCL